MGVKITGLTKLEQKLKEIGDRALKLQGITEIPLSNLLTPKFLKECSRFTSLAEMIDASGFEIANTDDFKAIPDGQWDEFIRKNTSFSNWNELLGDAGKDWTKQQLGI